MDFKKLPPVQEQIMKCVRCGKCRSVCPIFAEIRNETASPRGHVFIVQMLRDGKVDPDKDVYDNLANCLLCEACSNICPSGIDVHELNAAARSYIYEQNPSAGKELIFDSLWTRPGLLRTSSKFLWGAQKSGLQSLARNLGLMNILPGDLAKAESMVSSVPFKTGRSLVKEFNPAQGEKRYQVGYFLGCGTDLFQPQVANAVVEVLARNGCEVIVPRETRCCGQPHLANGKMDTAQKLLAHNVKIFNDYEFDYIVTDCASCSAALSHKNIKFVLGGLKIEDEAFTFADKVIDLTKFLVDVLNIHLPENSNAEKRRVTYHDPCHLANAQGIKSQPRELLRRIPGVELVEMAEANRCCGGSGTYAVTHYDMSMKILDHKMDNAMETGASYLATCCPSCMMQLQHGVTRHNWNCKVVHPIEMVYEYYQSCPELART